MPRKVYAILEMHHHSYSELHKKLHLDWCQTFSYVPKWKVVRLVKNFHVVNPKSMLIRGNLGSGLPKPWLG